MKRSKKFSHGATEARSVAETSNASLPTQTSPQNYILEREQKTSPDAPCPRASVRENIRNSRRDAEAQSVPVKIKTKDSGIPWIGEIPADWEVRRLKNVATLNPKTFFQLNEADYASFVPMECLRFGNIEKVERIYSELTSHTPFSEGDILVAKVTPCFENKNIAVAENLTNGVGFASSEIFIFRATAIDSQFLFYLFVSEYINAVGVSSMTGTGGLKRVSTNIVSCEIPVPPAGTQKRIAEFLDKKCAEIDALIALQEKMITELKSYKQSVITEAVTRGVPAKTKEIGISHGATEARSVAETSNASLPTQTSPQNYILEREQKTSPDAPCPRASVRENIGNSRRGAEAQSVPVKIKTKDSGIPWIGEIPAHWEVLPLKRLCKMNAGENLTSLEIEKDGEFPVYGGNGFRGFYKKYNCSGEYILVGRQGALAGNIHKVCGCFWATDHALITRCTSLTNIPYLSYLLDAMNLNQYALQTAAQPGLSVGVIQSLCTTVPPHSEQNAIVVFLDQKCAEIDFMISLKQQKISTLQNYKKSVIFEYVTGKKDA